MYKKRMAIPAAMEKIPGIADLEIPVEDMPGDEELNHQTEDLLAALGRELAQFHSDADLALVLNEAGDSRDGSATSVSTGSMTRPARSTVKPKMVMPTTIRIPPSVVDAYRSKAMEKGIGYQTLMIRALKSVADSW